MNLKVGGFGRFAGSGFLAGENRTRYIGPLSMGVRVRPRLALGANRERNRNRKRNKFSADHTSRRFTRLCRLWLQKYSTPAN